MENYWYVLCYNKGIYSSIGRVDVMVFIHKCKLYKNIYKRPDLAGESILTIEISNGSLLRISEEDTGNKDCSIDGYLELNKVIKSSKGHNIEDKFYRDHIKIVVNNFWDDISNSIGISKKYPKLVEKILKKINE